MTSARRFLPALALAVCAALLLNLAASAATPRELADEYCRRTNAAWCIDKDGNGTRESAPELHPLFTAEGIEHLRAHGRYYDPNDVEPTPTPGPTPAPTASPTATPPPTPSPTALPGTSLPSLSAGNPTATRATLTIANRSGNWHYKHTTPSDGTCSTAQSGTTATVTGLSPGTRYVFGAYSDSSCASLLATASPVTTLTPALAASNLASTTATLTISNWAVNQDGNWHYKANKTPDNSCSSAVSTEDVGLTGLSASTAYTYTAYSDSNCTDTKAITAELTFSTPGAPTLSAGNVTATTARLTVGNHSGNWHYKGDTGPHTDCSSAVSGTTADLTGLTKGTQYTYTAYSDSNCNNSLATASPFTTTTPALAASSVAGTTARLTLSGWTTGKDGSWYYKANKAPHTSCSSAISGTTANLTDLGANTEYTYTAYSDSNCNNLLATASAFTTKALSASAVTATTATLTLANHSGNWHYKANRAPHTGCSTAQTGATVNLTGLTKNASYIYRAYSDSNCNNLLATASAFMTDNPGLASSGVTATTATLTISNWASADGDWHYKHTTPSDGTCSSGVSGTTADLTGLDTNTRHIFKAYSNSGCTTEVAAASAFTTDNPGLSASSPTATTATLTISNWASADGDWHYKHTTPSGGDCSSGVSGTTANPTGLDTNTRHIFKAYSNSGCTTEVATASAFTTDNPGLDASGVTATTATLTLSDWDLTDDGGWYYKANKTPDDSCSSDAVTTAAVNLTGLAKSTEYVYTAYSDSGCSTGNEIASETFTTLTPTLAATGDGGTGGTLTLGNWTAAWRYKADTGPDNSCSDEVSAGTTTASLSGLTAGTSYAYKAYSDSGCATELAAAGAFIAGTVVTNLDESSSGNAYVGSTASTRARLAAGFSTGSNSGGYTLKHVVAKFAAKEGSPGGIAVNLYGASGNEPGTSLATLSGSDPDTAGDYTYTCSGSGCDLAKDTTYFIVIGAPNSSLGDNKYWWSATRSDSETRHPSGNGWTIGNQFFQATDNNPGQWYDYIPSDTGLLMVVAVTK